MTVLILFVCYIGVCAARACALAHSRSHSFAHFACSFISFRDLSHIRLATQFGAYLMHKTHCCISVTVWLWTERTTNKKNKRKKIRIGCDIEYLCTSTRWTLFLVAFVANSLVETKFHTVHNCWLYVMHAICIVHICKIVGARAKIHEKCILTKKIHETRIFIYLHHILTTPRHAQYVYRFA